MNYLSEENDWKKFWKNNLTIALVLYAKNHKIYLCTIQNITQILKKKTS